MTGGRTTELGYALHELPPGRYAFRRWRWELWDGAALLAAGWRLSQAQAETALRVTAVRRLHARMGLHALRPERATVQGRFCAADPVRIECGPAACLLVPRLPYELGAARAA